RRGARPARVDHHERPGGALVSHRGELRGPGLQEPRRDPHRGQAGAARSLPHRAHHHPIRERDLPARRRGALMEGAWTRRPAAALARLAGRPLLLLSARDLLLAAQDEAVLLVALLAPVAAASAGF